jgi:hypothetical protein
MRLVAMTALLLRTVITLASKTFDLSKDRRALGAPAPCKRATAVAVLVAKALTASEC